MFIAMNRFRIKKGKEEAFERMWAERDSHLSTVPGFMEFNLLRGAEEEDHTVYISHTMWQSSGHFEDWTKSEAFGKAHGRAGAGKDFYLGPPQFESFTAVPALTMKA